MKSWPELIGSGNPENGDYLAGHREQIREALEMTMIERVARVIALFEGSRIVGPGQSRATKECGWKGDGAHLEQFVESHWKEYRSHACAAVEAMRIPTEEMRKAGTVNWDPMDGGPIKPMFDPIKPWKAMIDAALKE